MVRKAFDTLGSLQGGGYGITIRCRRCQQNYNIRLSELIQKRGASRRIVGMEPISCPACHTSSTETLIRAPKELAIGRD